jgi:hypothetical protein
LYLVTPFDDGVIALLKHRAAEPDWTREVDSISDTIFGKPVLSA